MSVTIYVEGGGTDNETRTKCRKGFSGFIKKMFPGKDMPTIVACGGRSEAYRDYRIALKSVQPGEHVILLVDSEAPVASTASVWQHLSEREGDKWVAPEGATDEEAHLMVQCMESWFVADRESVIAWYDDKNFRASKLPRLRDGSVEPIEKAVVAKGLDEATKDTSKSRYHKTKHGFALLEQIDPAKVRAASVHADEFYKALEARLKDRSQNPRHSR